jgi:LPS-assembly protein
MSARIKSSILLALGCGLLQCGSTPFAATIMPQDPQTLADQLGWIASNTTICGGYYLEQPFVYAANSDKNKAIEVTGSQALFSQHGTTVLEGQVSLLRFGQQITANKAYIYRDGSTGKITSMDLLGNVHLREPSTLVVAKRGNYNFETKHKSLLEILYRTSIVDGKNVTVPEASNAAIQQQRKITSLTAWGKAYEFSQTEPNIYELNRSSFSTCPPTSPAWKVKSSHLVLNKNTGRGYATHARLYVKDVPVFYMPYFNFSIDHQRKSGFLWPTVGNKSSSSNIYSAWGPYVLAPFYWNMAPNYDMTITPGLLSKRGVRITDRFRYLSSIGHGYLNISLLPNDTLFKDYQEYAAIKYAGTTNSTTQAELTRLVNANTTRKNLAWRDDTQFNTHWSTHVDFNYAGDDYDLRDFGSDLNEITQNQLLQEGDLYYKSKNWNFIGRLQTYQTLHPIDENLIQNQYRRAPQLMLNADYPDQRFGLEYFINSEATHFDIRNTPGTIANLPVGNRLHLQPGISLPLYWPYFFISPRVQLSMTSYNLYQTAETRVPNSAQRSIPIFDMAMGFSFTRRTSLFNHIFQQTLDPQIYYTYIPYRNQTSIQIFDTTVSTLTYDQIFNYNRFSSIDRIGDANQLGVGLSTRLLDEETGLEKIRIGVGEIIYFSNRRVTFCNTPTCTDNPFNPANHWRLSPVSGLMNYTVNPSWSFDTNAIFNPISKQLGNAAVGLHYKPDERHLLNFGYGYVFNEDPLSGSNVNSAQNNIKLSDFSFSWPATNSVSVLGRWSQNWNQQHLQNLLYGLQYDTCCWAMQLVGGRAFANLDATQNNSPKYNDEFYIQFSLKGLGNIGSGDPSGLLRSITGYNTQFGQEF